MPGLHHVEIWVADLEQALGSWRWLLAEVGFVVEQTWPDGESWGAAGSYLSFTTSPNLSAAEHDRRRPGVNHLAFKVGTPDSVDLIMANAPSHGWSRLYHDRYPHAGGPDSYAGWLENVEGFKAEVVAEQY